MKMSDEFYASHDVVSLTGFDEHNRKDRALPESAQKYLGLTWLWELEKQIRTTGMTPQMLALIENFKIPINPENFEGQRMSALADPDVRSYLSNGKFPLILGLGFIYRDKSTKEELRLMGLQIKEDARPEMFVVEAKNQDGELRKVPLARLYESFEQLEQMDFTSPKSPMLPEKFRLFYDMETHEDLENHIEDRGADMFLRQLMREHHIR